MSYSTDDQVLGKIAHVKVPSGLVTPMRVFASNQIDIRIRKLYVTPVVSIDTADMQYLQDIEADLAAGRLIQNIATLHSLKDVSAIGIKQENSALKRIDDILTEKIILQGAQVNPNANNIEVNFSTIILDSPDTVSAFGRPLSGIENDAIDGNYDSNRYNPIEDLKNEDDPYPKRVI
jgi:hypothetical protein